MQIMTVWNAPTYKGRLFTDPKKNIGTPKTDSAKQTLKEINPDISVNLYPIQVTADNIEELIRPYDFIIDATEISLRTIEMYPAPQPVFSALLQV